MRVRTTKVGEKRKVRNMGLFLQWTRELGGHVKLELSRRACSAMESTTQSV